MAESHTSSLKLGFDPRLRLEFHGATITCDAGLPAARELDEAPGLAEVAITSLFPPAAKNLQQTAGGGTFLPSKGAAAAGARRFEGQVKVVTGAGQGIGAAIAFFASQDASYITGQVMAEGSPTPSNCTSLRMTDEV